MSNLIDPQLVTIQQLTNIFNNAYIKAEHHDDKTIRVYINNRRIFVAIPSPSEKKIEISSYTSILPREEMVGHESFICEHINKMNAGSFSKFFFQYINDTGFLCIERMYPYSFGLNPAQLVEDCNTLNIAMKDAVDYLAEVLREKGIIE